MALLKMQSGSVPWGIGKTQQGNVHSEASSLDIEARIQNHGDALKRLLKLQTIV
jgi:hypothetical protein